MGRTHGLSWVALKSSFFSLAREAILTPEGVRSRPAITAEHLGATLTATHVPRILAMIFRGDARTPTIYKWSEPGRIGEQLESTELPPRAAAAAAAAA